MATQRTKTKLKKDLWTVFSRYIRLRDALDYQQNHPEYFGEPLAVCVTCRRVGKALGQGGMQAGHFIPGRQGSYVYDERQVNAQCYRCNVELKGNWPEYLEFMVAKYGQETVDHMMYEQRRETVKYAASDLEELENTYKEKVKALEAEL